MDLKEHECSNSNGLMRITSLNQIIHLQCIFVEKSDIHQKELNIHQQNKEYLRKLREIANISLK